MNSKKENYHINKIYDKNKNLDDILDESIKSFSSSVTIYKNNKKILNEDLISKMIRQRVNQKQMQKCKMFSNTSFTGYGYLWYKYKNLIIAYGYLGQQLIIDKKRKIVASRLLQAKWDNKNFNKEINKNKIYLNNFKFLIEKI